jgi:hypothetical protein
LACGGQARSLVEGVAPPQAEHDDEAVPCCKRMQGIPPSLRLATVTRIRVDGMRLRREFEGMRRAWPAAGRRALSSRAPHRPRPSTIQDRDATPRSGWCSARGGLPRRRENPSVRHTPSTAGLRRPCGEARLRPTTGLRRDPGSGASPRGRNLTEGGDPLPDLLTTSPRLTLRGNDEVC